VTTVRSDNDDMDRATVTDAKASAAATIVVGVDGSEASKDALRWAARQAELTGATLRVLTSWHIPSLAYGSMAPLPEGLDLAGSTKQALDDTITEVLGAKPAVALTREVVEGPAALELLEASKGADLLVIGSRGHGAFTGMLLGSVSEHCVSHASCPVLVVRHPHDSA
jgi:nucleotide-binding universal stress UspA family protein